MIHLLTGKRALIVEDDLHVCEVIKATLEMQNMEVETAHDGRMGLEWARRQGFDFLILDIMLPEMDGFEVCRQLRQDGYLEPIIMLTAKAEEMDRVLGLEIGADDYITKPFSPRELVARLKAVMRRQTQGEQLSSRQLRLGEVIIHKEQYRVTVNGQPVEFTPKEFELLLCLAEHPEQTFTRDRLLEHVWGYDAVAETRTIDEHIKRLRKKLREAKCSSIGIRTVWGVGYQLRTVQDGD